MTCPMSKMQHIPASSLTDLPTRIKYLSDFLELTQEDAAAINAAAPLIAPLVPTVLDIVYKKLLSFDITAQAFVPKNTDYEGETVKSVQDLTLDHPQIAMRKDFLKNYLVKLVTTSDLTPTSPFWDYLDKVGLMHTGLPGFKHREHRPDLRVEYIHMSALLGHVISVVVGAVMDMDIDNETKKKAIVGLNKVLWIQNDLFARHYISEPVGSGEGVSKGLPNREEKKEENKGLFGGLMSGMGQYF